MTSAQQLIDYAATFNHAALMDLEGIGRIAYHGQDGDTIPTLIVAGKVACDPRFLYDLTTAVSPGTPPDTESVKPAEIVDRFLAFEREEAHRIHQKVGGLAPEECWNMMQRVYAAMVVLGGLPLTPSKPQGNDGCSAYSHGTDI